MTNQLKVAFFKLRRSIIFWAVIMLMSVVSVVYGYVKLSIASNTSEVFMFTIGDTSFMFISSIVTSWFIGNDFTNRTIHNEIKMGYSRWSVILVRELPGIISGMLIQFIFIAGSILGYIIKSGYEPSVFSSRNLVWLLVVMIQIGAFQTMVVFICFLLKKAAAVIAGSVCFTFIGCNVLRNFFDSKIFTMSCFCLAQNHENSTLLISFSEGVVTVVFFLLFTYLAFRKADID